MNKEKKEENKKWIAVAYFFAEKDDEEWLVLENENDEGEHRIIRGESIRGKDDIAD